MASTSKPLGKLEEAVVNQIKDQGMKPKTKEEEAILARMRQLHFNEQDVFQACSGWTDSVLAKHVHVDSEAATYVQRIQSLRAQEPADLNGVKQACIVEPSGQKVVDAQQDNNGSELPHLQNNSQ